MTKVMFEARKSWPKTNDREAYHPMEASFPNKAIYGLAAMAHETYSKYDEMQKRKQERHAEMKEQDWIYLVRVKEVPAINFLLVA